MASSTAFRLAAQCLVVFDGVAVYFAGFALIFASLTLQYKLTVCLVSLIAYSAISSQLQAYKHVADDFLWNACLSCLFMSLCVQHSGASSPPRTATQGTADLTEAGKSRLLVARPVVLSGHGCWWLHSHVGLRHVSLGDVAGTSDSSATITTRRVPTTEPPLIPSALQRSILGI